MTQYSHSDPLDGCCGTFPLRACLALVTLSLASCGEPLFPASAVKDLNPSLQMGIFNPEVDIYFKGHLARVGGRIVGVEETTEGLLITAMELPLTQRATRVAETAKSDGWFVFLYRGAVDRKGSSKAISSS